MAGEAMRLNLLFAFIAVASQAVQAEEEPHVRLADCEMMQRHVDMLRASDWPRCRSVDTPFLSTVAGRSQAYGACAVGDLADPALQGFSCWITENIETAMLSCMRPVDYGTINTVQSGWKAASPIFVDRLRRAARCPVSNGDSGFATLTIQGSFLDQFARPEFGFVVNLGDELSTLERAVQSFGTGDPLLPWTQSGIPEGVGQIGVETYAITACREGTACDSTAFDPALGAEGWSHETLAFETHADPSGWGVVVSALEVSFRKAWENTPDAPIRSSCGIGSWTEPCAMLEEGAFLMENLEMGLGRREFQNLTEVTTQAEFDDLIDQIALQLPDKIASGDPSFVLPYAWRHLFANEDRGFIAEFTDKLRSGEALFMVRELTECPIGGVAMVLVLPDTTSDGHQSIFSASIMALFGSSCPLRQTTVLARSIGEGVNEAMEGLQE